MLHVQRAILEVIANNPTISFGEIAEFALIGKTTVYRHVKSLIELGVLSIEGKKRPNRYRIDRVRAIEMNLL